MSETESNKQGALQKMEILVAALAAIAACAGVIFGHGEIFDFCVSHCVVSPTATATASPLPSATFTFIPVTPVATTPVPPTATGTPVPPTPTATATATRTATPADSHASLRPGDDWEQNCISAQIWSFYSLEGETPSQNDGCYVLLKWGVSALDGNLNIFTQNSRTPTLVGIMVPLPQNVSVSFSLDVNALENAEFWAGIAESSTIPAGKYLFAKGDGYFDLMNVENVRYPTFIARYHAYGNPTHYRFTMTVEGTKFEISRDGYSGDMFSPLPIPFAPRYLFLGYRTHAGEGAVDIDLSIRNLEIR